LSSSFPALQLNFLSDPEEGFRKRVSTFAATQCATFSQFESFSQRVNNIARNLGTLVQAGTFIANRWLEGRTMLMWDEKTVDLKNHTVNFRICDIFYPDYQQVLFGLHGNDVLRGMVIDLSEAGELASSFAEIEVDELEQRVIVPIDRILGICE